ncbi:HNH endonuclease [Mucilaginibacter flavidus]|uniref:HNH endonuclease n=1 Tax=Mucilaginibacter flavidus TaxID=2949309 RepID=UPI002092C935|nr:HNH endonuclease [Mucilaginibacter flavidus]MCO5949230.1 HNH endonuclease [Mucilaginibacter flavidus]
MSLLNQFIDKLSRLKRANTIYGKAPHKPVLLLSIIELFDKGVVENNRFYINTDLVGAFLENWRLLVDTTHSADFTQPFYYLQSEKINGLLFWFLQPKPGCQVNAYIRSVNVLSNVLDYGYFSDNIYLLFTDAAARSMMRLALLNTYFPQRKAAFVQAKQSGNSYINNLENYLLNEPDVPYQPATAETEEDDFVRGGLFKKLVPKVYNNTCCITGMRLQSSYGHSFIDACHIIPFAVSHNDKVTNGLALCPNLHRAFDRGLVAISNNYRVIISPHLIESEEHPYNIKQLKGVEIALPQDKWHYPNLESLEWHRDKVFKG